VKKLNINHFFFFFFAVYRCFGKNGLLNSLAWGGYGFILSILFASVILSALSKVCFYTDIALFANLYFAVKT